MEVPNVVWPEEGGGGIKRGQASVICLVSLDAFFSWDCSSLDREPTTRQESATVAATAAKQLRIG